MQMTNALAYNNDDIYINTLETSVTQDRNNIIIMYVRTCTVFS